MNSRMRKGQTPTSQVSARGGRAWALGSRGGGRGGGSSPLIGRGGEASQGGSSLNCSLHVKVTMSWTRKAVLRPERSCASCLENKRAHVTKVIKIVNLSNSPAQYTRFWKSCFLSLSAINISNWIMLCWGTGCPVHCSVLSSISGLCPRDATTGQL